MLAIIRYVSLNTPLSLSQVLRSKLLVLHELGVCLPCQLDPLVAPFLLQSFRLVLYTILKSLGLLLT